jgi:hypothetical protein
MAELKRYRAVEGHVSHPTIKTFVGYRRVTDGSKQEGDFDVPGGHRWRKLPEGEVLPTSTFLRARVLDGSLEELPLEQPKAELKTVNRSTKGEG